MTVDKIVGIIGWPVSHSLSPLIHNSAFLEMGLDSWIYVPMPVSKFPYIRIKEATLGLRALAFQGANVTVPYKEAVVPYMDDLSENARIIGAVNTIAIDSAGRLVGHNTDASGFINDLKDHHIVTLPMNVLILGAGGSARAIAFGLLDNGCKSLTILNRTKSKADELAVSMQHLFSGKIIKSGPLDIEKLKELPPFDLVVNCTSVGMADSLGVMPWDEALPFTKNQIVYDLIYKPGKTALLVKAEADGAQAINGLGMLCHQAALAFTIWTGVQAPLDAMKKAALTPKT